MTKWCEIPCPQNNCAGMLAVTVKTFRSDAAKEDVYRLHHDPRICHSCHTNWWVSPFPCPDQQTLAEAYHNGEPL